MNRIEKTIYIFIGIFILMPFLFMIGEDGRNKLKHIAKSFGMKDEDLDLIEF